MSKYAKWKIFWIWELFNIYHCIWILWNYVKDETIWFLWSLIPNPCGKKTFADNKKQGSAAACKPHRNQPFTNLKIIWKSKPDPNMASHLSIQTGLNLRLNTADSPDKKHINLHFMIANEMFYLLSIYFILYIPASIKSMPISSVLSSASMI